LRILQLHSDFIEYKPLKKEVAIAEEAEKKSRRLENLIVLFTSVEEGDDEAVAKRAVDETNATIERLKTNRILIYPYAHLSSNLAKPSNALRILREMEKYAQEKGIETYRTPFGWNKKFSLSIKGHPLAEQLRVIAPAGEKKEAEKVSRQFSLAS
jgi:threonyl-tRNA synthetase